MYREHRSPNAAQSRRRSYPNLRDDFSYSSDVYPNYDDYARSDHWGIMDYGHSNAFNRGLRFQDRNPTAWDRFSEGSKFVFGKGPKGYQRSDARIYEEICERLTYQSGVDASEVEVSVKDGEVTLSGTVLSRGDKRRIEDEADDVYGVKDVHNQLRLTESKLKTPNVSEPH